MTGTARNPAQAPTLDGLIALTERLTELLADQARAFEQHRPQDAAATLEEVTRLANRYRADSAVVKSSPEMFRDAPAAARQRLLRATEAFESVLERQGRALAASKTITEGLVRAIAQEIASKRAGASYGPTAAALPGSATAITLNQRA
ncbi:MAG: flagellar basal body protein [Caulobacterales bacterium]